MSKRQHQITVGADVKRGVYIQGLTDHEASVIEHALAGDLDRYYGPEEALDLRLLIYEAWKRYHGPTGPGSGNRFRARDILDKHLGLP